MRHDMGESLWEGCRRWGGVDFNAASISYALTEAKRVHCKELKTYTHEIRCELGILERRSGCLMVRASPVEQMVENGSRA